MKPKAATAKRKPAAKKAKAAARKKGRPGYAAFRARQAAISRARSAAGREIGPLPKVANQKRRARCRDNPELFYTTYFPSRFYLPFGVPHREAIARLKACTEAGGLFACAMPRGTGKDTITECEVIRAVAYGWRRFVLLVAATEDDARRSLAKIKAELETNELLLADFPEICYPVRRLERIHNRAAGQTLNRRPTRIEWTADALRLPAVKGRPSSGALIQVAGLTGAIRGRNELGPDGRPLRPDLVVVNDPQTRESAKSPQQTTDREAVVQDDVLMSAGPTTTIAAVMLCTVIYRNDLSDRFLDPARHPEWRPLRTKMIERFPDRMDLWDRYAEIRRESLRAGDEGRRATAFYAEHRAEMDRGAVVTWPERVKAGELSGLQSAMNVYCDNPRGFYAECQNDPLAAEATAGVKALSAQAVAARLSGFDRLVVPNEAAYLTAFVDPGKYLHWYAVVAWSSAFAGWVVDYGCWPRQARAVFEAADARPLLSEVPAYHGLTEPQLVYAGLRDLTAEVLGRVYYRANGTPVAIDRTLVDSGYERDAVYQFARQSQLRALIHPSKGIGRSATTSGVASWKPRPHEHTGWHWRLTAGEGSQGAGLRVVQFDTDVWKSFLYGRLSVPPGGPWLSLWGRSPADHALLGEHCAAEYAEPVTIKGETFDKWRPHVGRADNHLFDVLVGCTVAANVAGCPVTASPDGTPAAPRGPVAEDLGELQRRLRAERRKGGRP